MKFFCLSGFAGRWSSSSIKILENIRGGCVISSWHFLFFHFLEVFFIGFHGWIGGILAYRITHGFSRNFGLWPMAGARNIPLLFLSRRFRRWRRFFFVGAFCPTDFTDYTNFLWNLWRIALSNLRGYLHRPNRSLPRKSVSNSISKKPPNKFRVIRWIKIPDDEKSV